MNTPKYESPAAALNDLRNRGYDAEFETRENCLYCANLDLRLYEEEFKIDEAYHFEAPSEVDNNTVVYALTSPTGVKGIVVDDRELFADNIHFSEND